MNTQESEKKLKAPPYIRTVPHHGYRCIGTVGAVTRERIGTRSAQRQEEEEPSAATG